MLDAFSALMDQVIPRIIPVPTTPLSPSFNAVCTEWVQGDPIPDSVICMTQVSLTEMGEYRRLRENNNGPSDADLVAMMLLASLCNHKGELFVPKPANPLAYSEEEIRNIGAKLSPDLAYHMFSEIQYFNGWLRRPSGTIAEEAAKN